MLLRCGRLKRIHIRLLILVAIVATVLFLYIRLLTVEGGYEVGNVYEVKLREYEAKIVAGLGDNGEPAFLEGKDAIDGDEALKTFALNTVLSDRMPLNRKLRDPRNRKYDFNYLRFNNLIE